MKFTAVAEKSYALLYRETLGVGDWQSLTNVAAQPITQEITVVDPSAGVVGQRFYQLVTPSGP